MDKAKAAQALKALATSDNRTQIAKLRDIIDDVEAALAAGATREQVHQTLLAQGFTFTLHGFDQARMRIKKQAAKIPAKTPASTTVEPTAGADSTTTDQPAKVTDRDAKFNQYFQQSNPLTRSKK